MLATLAACLVVSAPHDPGLSSLTAVRHGTSLQVSTAFANAEFAAISGLDTDHDGRIAPAELQLPDARWLAWIRDRVQVSSAGHTLSCASVAARIGEEDDVELHLTFPTSDPTLRVELPLLDSLSHGHRCYASVLDRDGTLLVDALLHVDAPGLPLPAADAPARGSSVAGEFFVLGVEHILIGFDHLAFLLVLLASGVGMRRTLATITAFSVAHSVTLTAAALDWLRLPGTLVEATIAASIVLVAAANIVQRHRRAPQRWSWAFAFGLVHGFGFAGVLAEFEVGAGNVLVPLLSFNLGVEVGQLACALAALPLLVLCHRRNPRATSLTLSLLAGAIGLFWLLERTLP